MRRVFPPDQADIVEAQRRAGSIRNGGFCVRRNGLAGISSDRWRRFRGRLILNESGLDLERVKPDARQCHLAFGCGVAGAGHACSIDQPENFNQAVRELAHSRMAIG